MLLIGFVGVLVVLATAWGASLAATALYIAACWACQRGSRRSIDAAS